MRNLIFAVTLIVGLSVQAKEAHIFKVMDRGRLHIFGTAFAVKYKKRTFFITNAHVCEFADNYGTKHNLVGGDIVLNFRSRHMKSIEYKIYV